MVPMSYISKLLVYVFLCLNRNHQMSILHFVLHNDANGLKDRFVLGNSMPKLLDKNIEDLDACIKGFMSRFSLLINLLTIEQS